MIVVNLCQQALNNLLNAHNYQPREIHTEKIFVDAEGGRGAGCFGSLTLYPLPGGNFCILFEK